MFIFQDSGMGQESPRKSRETAPTTEDAEVHDDHVYAFMVEECVLLAFDGHHHTFFYHESINMIIMDFRIFSGWCGFMKFSWGFLTTFMILMVMI